MPARCKRCQRTTPSKVRFRRSRSAAKISSPSAVPWRPALGQPLPPQCGLGTAAGKQRGWRRLGRSPGTDQVIAPVRRGADDPFGLDDPEHKPGAGGPRLSASETESLAGLGQHRRLHRETVLAQHQIGEPVNGGKGWRQPLQHGADLPASPRQPGPRPEPERRQAHRPMAFLLGEFHCRTAATRRDLIKRRQIGRRLRRANGCSQDEIKSDKGGRSHHEPSLPVFSVRCSSGAVQSRRTVWRSASTVRTAARPA